MLMVFAELTMQDRAILNTSCKRFRELDFELAKKKLINIHVRWVIFNTYFIFLKLVLVCHRA